MTASPLGTLRDLLEKSKQQIAMALPRHLTPERMIRVALTAYQQTPDLAVCDPVSIVGCVMQASQLGLDIGGILAQSHLVPFWNSKNKRKECQLIVGYRGYLVLARRSGEVSHFSAHVVHSNDEFDFAYGTDAHLDHKPNLENPGNPIAAYAVLKLRDGSHDFEVLGWPYILECQQKYAKKSQKGELYGPWIDHLEEMARKTAIRRLAKRAPVSVEIQHAAALEDRHEAGLSQIDMAPLTAVSHMEQLAARVEHHTAQNGAAEPDSNGTSQDGPILSRVEEIAALAKSKGLDDPDIHDLCAAAGCESLAEATPEQLDQIEAKLKELGA